MAGGNGLSDYARSIMRNADFRDMRPRLRKTVGGGDQESTNFQSSGDTTSVNAGEQTTGTGTDSSANEQTPLLSNGKPSTGHGENGSLDQTVPLYKTLSATAQRRVQDLTDQREETRRNEPKDSRPALLTTRIQRPDGTAAEVIVGESTLPQTIFNSANVLIGVGLLSLPLAFRYSGWVCGMLGLLASAVVTKYTAGLLAKCLDVDSSLANFADIAYVAFGRSGKAVTSLIITLELMTACVGLVILFADSLGALIDGLEDAHWKVVCGLILLPLNFLPMRWLGFTSFLGIFCSLGIIFIAFGAGLWKSEGEGSLWDVARTTAWPESWMALPLSIGLIMALWEGHSIFPNIYRDMRDPPKYASGLRYTFAFVVKSTSLHCERMTLRLTEMQTSVDIAMAVVGYLLYGSQVKDELTKNMLGTGGYPSWLKVVVLVLIAILPLTKFPLHAAPIVSTLEVLTLIDPRAALLSPNRFNQSVFLTHLLRTLFRLLVTAVAVLIAIAVPSFEIFSALMGGAFGILTCMVLPVGFHLRMFEGDVGRWERMGSWVLIGAAVGLGAVGTTWEFLPSD